MDFLEMLGTIIGISGLVIYIVLYKVLVGKKTKKIFLTKLILFVFLVITSLSGVALWQKAHDIRKYEFNQEEINLINTTKHYEDFTEQEKQLFVSIVNKYLLNDEQKVAEYKDKIFSLDVEGYLYNNKHRTDLTREEAEKFVTNDWQSKRKFNIEND